MNTDLLRESIDRATSDPTTPPDIDRLKQRGRRRSAVRTGVAALATVGVVAVGTYAVQSIGGPGESKQLPVAIRSQGPAMAFKAYDPTSVHVAGKTVEPAHETTLDASAVTGAGVMYISGDSNGTPYLMRPSGSEKRLGDPVNPDGKRTWASEVVVDTSRRTAAWSADVPGPEVRLNLFDAATEEVTDSVTFDPAVVAGRSAASLVRLVAVHDGVVYGTFETSGSGGDQQSFAWDPALPDDEQVYVATEPGTVVSAMGADRLVLTGEGDAYGGPDRAPLDPSVRISRIPGDAPGKRVGVESATLSPDGNWALVDPDRVSDSGVQIDGPDADTFNDPSYDHAAMNLETGTMLRFHSQGVTEATFDDDGSVLMIEVTPDGGDRLIDCTLPSEQCTTVLDDVPSGGAGTDDIEMVGGFID